jgi:hypothetical protein
MKKLLKTKDLCTETTLKLQIDPLKRHITMDPDLKKRNFKHDKKIENLFNIIKKVGSPMHYVQQACISNLLVTVFAARHLDNLLITNIFQPLTYCFYGRPTRKELTAGPHA